MLPILFAFKAAPHPGIVLGCLLLAGAPTALAQGLQDAGRGTGCEITAETLPDGRKVRRYANRDTNVGRWRYRHGTPGYSDCGRGDTVDLGDGAKVNVPWSRVGVLRKDGAIVSLGDDKPATGGKVEDGAIVIFAAPPPPEGAGSEASKAGTGATPDLPAPDEQPKRQ